MISNDVVPDFSSVHVVFVEEQPNAIVSGFGHLFIILSNTKVINPTELLSSPALNFAAITDKNSDEYMRGKYQIHNSHQLLRTYSKNQDRNLIFLELDLEETQINVLKSKIKTALSTSFNYDFLRNNCGSALYELLTSSKYPDKSIDYRTPRNTFYLLTRALPIKNAWLQKCQAEILFDLANSTGKESIYQVRAAILDPENITKINCTTLKLMTLNYLLSKDTNFCRESLSNTRNNLLLSEGGKKSAKSIIGAQMPINILNDLNSYTMSSEGPSLSIGLVHNMHKNSPSLSIDMKAGFRNFLSTPIKPNYVREISFLDLHIELLQGESLVDLNLVQMDIYQDFFGLTRSASGGFSIGYNMSPNLFARNQLNASTWLGASTKTSIGTVGIKGVILGNELNDKPTVEVLPSAFWFLVLPNLGLKTEITAESTANLAVSYELRYKLKNSTSAFCRYLRTFDDTNQLTIGTSFSF